MHMNENPQRKTLKVVFNPCIHTTIISCKWVDITFQTTSANCICTVCCACIFERFVGKNEGQISFTWSQRMRKSTVTCWRQVWINIKMICRFVTKPACDIFSILFENLQPLCKLLMVLLKEVIGIWSLKRF